jgi:hypothetical protein
VAWGEAAATACDAICPSGHHRQDWDPHRIHVEPFLMQAKPGQVIAARLAVSNPLSKARTWQVQAEPKCVAAFAPLTCEIGPATLQSFPLRLKIAADAKPGRHVVPLVIAAEGAEDSSDVVVVIDVTPS